MRFILRDAGSLSCAWSTLQTNSQWFFQTYAEAFDSFYGWSQSWSNGYTSSDYDSHLE